MAYTLTPWGYEIDGNLPPLITTEKFNALTSSAWAGDARLTPAIAAASAAIRNFCGWHVTPSASCRATLDADGSRSLWLRSTFVTAISDVRVRDKEVADYEWSRLGQVLTAERVAPGLQAALVTYTAGLPATDDIEALVAGVVAHTIATAPQSYGVVSESTGGVSITRAQGAAYAGISASLTDSERIALAPYKVVSSHGL